VREKRELKRELTEVYPSPKRKFTARELASLRFIALWFRERPQV